MITDGEVMFENRDADTKILLFSNKNSQIELKTGMCRALSHKMN